MKNLTNAISSTTARDLALNNFGNMKHYDSRIVRRTILVAENLFKSTEKRFSCMFDSSAERKGAYRLIENKNLEYEDLIKSITSHSFERLKESKPKRIIVPQDTTNYSRNPFEQVEGLETLGNEYSAGLLIHSALWLSEQGVPEGLLSAEIYKHNIEKKTVGKKKKKKDYRKIPIEEKENFRWLKVVDLVSNSLPADVQAIYVADREGDFYEYLQDLIERKASFVTRCKHQNRIVLSQDNQPSRVSAEIANSPVQAYVAIDIPIGRNKFEKVKIAVKWHKIRFQPQKAGRINYSGREPFDIGCVSLEGVRSNGKKIDWVLYTDLPLKNLYDAMEVIRIYKLRWRIEEFHLVLKSGIGIEKVKLRDAENIKRFISLCIPMAIHITRLRYLAKYSPKLDISEVLGPKEIKALKKMIRKRRGIKQRIISIKECVEYIAFIGGWMGRKGDGPPGVRTLWRGLRDVKLLAEFC